MEKVLTVALNCERGRFWVMRREKAKVKGDARLFIYSVSAGLTHHLNIAIFGFRGPLGSCYVTCT